MVRAPSRQQARWYREGFATCRRGWCGAREAAPQQAELQLSSCCRRRPFEFGPRPFGRRDISTNAALALALALGGIDLVEDGMKKVSAGRLQRIAVHDEGNKCHLNCAQGKVGSLWRCRCRLIYPSFPLLTEGSAKEAATRSDARRATGTLALPCMTRVAVDTKGAVVRTFE